LCRGKQYFNNLKDVTSDISLVNMGEIEARNCIDLIYNDGKIENVDRDYLQRRANLSKIMFVDPESKYFFN
jgi:hypothetical protein